MSFEGVKECIRSILLSFDDKTLLTAPRLHKKIEEGKAFTVGHRFEGVAADASVDLYFENPSGSGVDVHLVIVAVLSMAQAWVDVYANNSVGTPGTGLTPVNMNLRSAVVSKVNAEYGGSYTLGDLLIDTVCPGGSLIRAVGWALELGETLLIPPGKNILVRATNKSGSAQDLAIRIIWWEE